MTLSEPEIGALIATLARTGGLAATCPLIGDQGVSMRARLVFVLVVTFCVGMTRPPVAFSAIPAVVVLEFAVGLVTGLTASVVMSRVAVAGQLMGLSLGLGFASQYDVHAGESAAAIFQVARNYFRGEPGAARHVLAQQRCVHIHRRRVDIVDHQVIQLRPLR